MKTLHILILAIAVSSMMLSSCSPALYSTAGQNVPLFHEKGEVSMNVGYSTASMEGSAINPFGGGDGDGFNVQAAVAIDSAIALFTSYYNIHGNSDWNVKGSYFEMGGGLFNYNPTKRLAGELFFGLGYGSIRNSADGQQINARFLKYFAQPSGAFSSKGFDIAITPRLGVVHYLSVDDSESGRANDFLKEKKISLVLEPGITIRFGHRNVKFQYQMNYTTFDFDAESDSEEDFDPIYNCYGSFSIFFMISDYWKTLK